MDKFVELFNKLPLYKLTNYVMPPCKKPKFTGMDVINVLILSFAAYAVRFKNFQYPGIVVFDEVHFGNFTNFYINHEFFFDIHPPLAKFIFAIFGHLSGYQGDIKFNDYFSIPYPHEGYIPLRITPIIMSSLVPGMLYIAMRMAPFSRIASFTTGCMVCFDTSMICEGKFILTDGTLHFFTAFALAFINYWLHFQPNTKEYQLWMYIASIAAGCAFSVKNTALSLCFVIGITQVFDLLIPRRFKLDANFYPDICLRALKCAAPGFILHFILWTIHILVLPYIGEDSSEQDIKSFKLVNHTDLDKSSHIGLPPIIGRVLGTVGSTLMSNAMNYKPHPYMSRPFDWPLLTDVWVGFSNYAGREIACIGNLLVYAPAFFGVFAAMAGVGRKKWSLAMRLIVGYWMSFLPFCGVPRTMFLYHYIIPLMFGCCCLGAAIDLWLPKFWRGYVATFVIAAAIAGYIIWSPFVYGTLNERSGRIWNRAWTDGKPGRHQWVQSMQNKYDNLKKAEEAMQTPTINVPRPF